MLDYRHCTLCPRACGVDRTAGERGFCQMPDHILAARAALHYWEEPLISGSFGSGAVFFSGCTLRCAFCQNGVISQENFGKEVSSQELRAAFERLIDEGCQNINLVTPTHFLPSILPALAPEAACARSCITRRLRIGRDTAGLGGTGRYLSAGL